MKLVVCSVKMVLCSWPWKRGCAPHVKIDRRHICAQCWAEELTDLRGGQKACSHRPESGWTRRGPFPLLFCDLKPIWFLESVSSWLRTQRRKIPQLPNQAAGWHIRAPLTRGMCCVSGNEPETNHGRGHRTPARPFLLDGDPGGSITGPARRGASWERSFCICSPIDPQLDLVPSLHGK